MVLNGNAASRVAAPATTAYECRWFMLPTPTADCLLWSFGLAARVGGDRLGHRRPPGEALRTAGRLRPDRGQAGAVVDADDPPAGAEQGQRGRLVGPVVVGLRGLRQVQPGGRVDQQTDAGGTGGAQRAEGLGRGQGRSAEDGDRQTAVAAAAAPFDQLTDVVGGRDLYLGEDVEHPSVAVAFVGVEVDAAAGDEPDL